MSAACPKGHTSEALDYCSVCGTPMTTAAPAAEVTVERCPNCGSPPQSATACLECGYLLGAPDVVAPWEEQNWEILVRPDRVFYESQEPDGMDFPEQTSTRRFLLTGDHVRIGRHSSTRGIDAEIDLSGALEDTGVSHRHAVLMRQPEGNWALVDLDSTNGTFLNADAEPILANHPIALSDGDQIHIGGWTTLTIERLDPASVARLEAESRPSKDTRNLARGRRPWEVGLLGPLRLVVAGQEVPITAAKTRAVLALLALRVGAPMSVPDLEWALWGEDEPKTAGTALRGYIASLRKLLPDRAIETTPQGAYRLVGSKYSVDVFRFERQMRQSLRKQVAEVALRVWTPQGAEVVALKQTEPPLDLSGGRVDAGPLAGDYATGSWGDEQRDFYLSVALPAGEVGDEMLAAQGDPHGGR